ncbi:MAG: Hpt domain-containing protein [Oscillospiraceae bacterium]|nr:Hpt domain-containing protein [Oscillospiraceae bacterium]
MWDFNAINLEKGLERVMGRKELYIQLLDKFFCDETVAGLKTAAESLNADELKTELHKLKGTAANLSVDLIAKRAAEIYEELKNNAAIDKIADNCIELAAEFDKTSNMYFVHKSTI